MLERPEQEAGDRRSTRCIEARGPWPFVTFRIEELADRTQRTRTSRSHRKGLHGPAVDRAVSSSAQETLATIVRRSLWAPSDLNWWIGTVFAIGSSLFALGSVLSLVPRLARALSLDSTDVNAVFFIGSIPFTTAAYLQLYQAANAPPFVERNPTGSDRRRAIFGLRASEIGWLSTALQFAGTLLFNLNTFDAMRPTRTWLGQDLEVWAPDIIGSTLFLVSGYLAFIETGHRHRSWNPSSISWWVTLANGMGCIGFMVSAVFAFVPPGGPNAGAVTVATAFTLQGAICFFAGSVLMLPESKSAGA